MRTISTVDRGNEILGNAAGSGSATEMGKFGKLSTAASCQQASEGTPQITHLALNTSSCSAPPPGHCELCVSLQEPSRSRNDSECELDERW